MDPIWQPVLGGVAAAATSSGILYAIYYSGKEQVMAVTPVDNGKFVVTTHRSSRVEPDVLGHIPGSNIFQTIGEPRLKDGKLLVVGERYSRFQLENGVSNRVKVNQELGR